MKQEVLEELGELEARGVLEQGRQVVEEELFVLTEPVADPGHLEPDSVELLAGDVVSVAVSASVSRGYDGLLRELVRILDNERLYICGSDSVHTES